MTSKGSDGKNPSLTLDEARDRCNSELTDALSKEWEGVFCALMSMGKSYGVPNAVAATRKASTVLMHRGHDEQYEQFLQWSDDVGIDAYRLPSFTHDCEAANGDLGDGEKERVLSAYRRGVHPSTIHESLNPKCEPGCTYRRRMAFEPSHFDLLVGHYTHAYYFPAIAGRSVFIDEFPGHAWESKVNTGRVSSFLKANDDIGVNYFTELLEQRSDGSLKDDMRAWVDEHGLRPSQDELLRDERLYGLAPVAVWGLLTSKKLSNGWEISSFSLADFTDDPDDLLEGYRVAFDPGSSPDMDPRIFVLFEPDLSPAKNVIGLDGTPTMELWYTVAGLSKKRQVLTDSERVEYLRDALQHEYIVTAPDPRPYGPFKNRVEERVTEERDAALFREITKRHGEKPGLITTKKAEEIAYDGSIFHLDDNGEIRSDMPSLVSEVEHYGNLKGSNRFKQKRVGVVVGYQDFGDGEIQQWGAYAGVDVPGGDAAHVGRSRDHGEYGNRVLRDSREHPLFQGTMRFGRDGKGATVYVDSSALPEWVPVSREARLKDLSGDNTKLPEVINAATGREHVTADDIAEAIGCHRDTAGKWLRCLTSGGYVERHPLGRGYTYSDVSLVGIDRWVFYYC